MKNITQHLQFIFLGLLFAGLLLGPGDARADVGLPPAQPGSSLSPGDYETEVQMVSERVEIDIPYDPSQWPPRAYLTADFQMYNTGKQDEYIEVWFPFGYIQPDSKAWKVIQVQDFRAWVDGKEMEVTLEKSDQINDIWAHWPVFFPNGEDVSIQVSYSMLDNLIAGPLHTFHSFYYTLETGAGWEGVIEEASITIKAPFPLQELTEFLRRPAFYISPEGYTIAENEIRWVLQDLEPTDEDNIEFHLLDLEIWHDINHSREILQSNPHDWEANYKLAKGLERWIDAQEYLKRDGYIKTVPDLRSLENLSRDCYLKVLENMPGDPSAVSHTLRYFEWNPSRIDPQVLQYYYDQAVQLFPDDQQLQEAYQEAVESGLIGEGPASSPTPSTTPPPTAAISIPSPANTSTPEAEPGSDAADPANLIIGILFIGAAAILIILAISYRAENLNTPE